jgi:hypothetical protein
MKQLAILLFLLATAIPAQASAGSCSLITGRTGWYVTVNRGPCYYRDFPSWCKRYVPAVIVQGQRIRCETVGVVATPTPRTTPKPVATPTPRTTPKPVATPTPERLRIPGFR